MFKTLKLVGSIFLILFLVLYCVLGLVCNLDVNPSILISAIVAAAFSIFVGVLTKALETKCPKCGKVFAMKEMSRKTIDERATTVDVERQVRATSGKVISTYMEAVPATQYIYGCVDKCKHCGYQRRVRRDATYRD